jgi:ubiquinone/menaquinone biosynthesis C-methylase UbiE
MKFKQIEVDRYDKRAIQGINQKKFIKNLEYLDVPYKFYYRLLKKIKIKKNLLEIASGMGEHTLKLIKLNFNVHATDISSKSVEIMKKRFSKYKNFSSSVADMENLPFKNGSFDIVCIVGGLSYGDRRKVMNEIYRVVALNGTVIIVDSLNNSFIYRFNRYLHYLKGNRTITTLKRMPDINLIKIYTKKFGYGEVNYFGSITWTFPFLKLILTEKLIKDFSNWVDKKFKIKGSAFKFVLMLKKIKK